MKKKLFRKFLEKILAVESFKCLEMFAINITYFKTKYFCVKPPNIMSLKTSPVKIKRLYHIWNTYYNIYNI